MLLFVVRQKSNLFFKLKFCTTRNSFFSMVMYMYDVSGPNKLSLLNQPCIITLEKPTTLMILSFQTDRPEQTVWTQIRLLLEEQSDQGLHSLPFSRYHSAASFCEKPHYSNFRIITAISWVSENYGI